MANLANLAYWQQVATLTYGKGKPRLPVLLPPTIGVEWVRLEISVIGIKPGHYRAGWLNQIVSISGKNHQFASTLVPLQFNSIHKFSLETGAYRLLFSPVDYLPHCTIRFYKFV